MRGPGMARAWVVGLAAAVALAGPAGAEVKVYLFDQTKPIETEQVFEEGVWVFYDEGESQYLFSVPRDRVERLEIVQQGAVRTLQITPPGQPVFPDFRREILLSIAIVQDKRVEDLRKQYLDEVTKAAQVAPVPAEAPGAGAAQAPAEAPKAGAAQAPSEAVKAGAAQASAEAPMARDILTARAATFRQEYGAALSRLGFVLSQVAKYRAPGPRPEYYFYRY